MNNYYNADSQTFDNSESKTTNTYTYELPAVKYISRGEKLCSGTQGSAGLDLYVNGLDLKDSIIYTGVHIEIPDGWVGLVIPRSSTGSAGFRLRNTMGVIDSDYRGEIRLAYEKGYNPQLGEKIAQLVLVPCWTGQVLEMESIDDLSDTSRGQGGFGSTGG